MNYLPRNRSKSLRRRIIAILAIFLILTLFFKIAGKAVVSLAAPVWRSENAAVRFFKTAFESVRSRKNLASENLLLKERVTSLELELSAFELSESREKSFEELLGRRLRTGEIIASVLTRPPQSPYDFFIIDAGKSDGVEIGSRVALPEGPMLGRVADVFASNSKVKLFSSSGERTEAVLERDNSPVILEGRGGGNFRIKVAREIPIEVGDRVVSVDVNYALLAVIGAVEVGPTDAFKEVLAKSPTNIFSVRFVKILP